MGDRGFAVACYDAATAAGLVGVLPTDSVATLVLLGDALPEVVAGAARLGATEVVVVRGAGRDVDVDATALLSVVPPGQHVVVGSDQRSRDLAGHLSLSLDLPLVWAVDAVRVLPDGAVEADRVVLGGTHRLVHRLEPGTRAVVSAKPGGVPDLDGSAGEPVAATTRAVDAAGAPRLHVHDVAGDAGSGASLTGARTIVSVGRGIGGADRVPLFRELADAFGAALGASRVAVDSGWIGFGHQVGQTGSAVAPDLYVAFGISGAIQHLAGMRGSKRVVAVNLDPEAPICRVADVVVVADAVEVATALLKKRADTPS